MMWANFCQGEGLASRAGHATVRDFVKDYYRPFSRNGYSAMTGIRELILGRLQVLDGFSHVRFILLFGSVAEGRAGKDSDIDICISCDGSRKDASRFRFAALTALSDVNADVRIFEQIPLIMRIQALKGEALYAPDPDILYAVAYTTIRDYEAFRHRLQDYTGEKVIT
jgi:hypothetical protein